MSGIQQIITQRNRVKQSQYVSEGITTATYGITPTNPVFTAIGCNTILVDNSSPNTAEQRISGDVDKKRKDFISSNSSMTIRTQMTFLDLALLQWVTTKPETPNVIDTPDESKTFIDSYLDVDGNEITRQFLGCKPTGWTFSEDRAGYLTLEITCSCKEILESPTPVAIGTGSFAAANLIAPYTHRDAGVLPFLYDGVGFTTSNFSSTGTLVQAMQDVQGSDTTLYAVPTQRTIAGAISIYKKNADLQNLAKTVDNSKDAVYTFDAANALSISLTEFLWLPSNEELSGDDAAATMENKSYEANGIVVVDA